MWILIVFLIKTGTCIPLMVTDQCLDICKKAELPALELVITSYCSLLIFIFNNKF